MAEPSIDELIRPADKIRKRTKTRAAFDRLSHVITRWNSASGATVHDAKCGNFRFPLIQNRKFTNFDLVSDSETSAVERIRRFQRITGLSERAPMERVYQGTKYKRINADTYQATPIDAQGKKLESRTISRSQNAEEFDAITGPQHDDEWNFYNTWKNIDRARSAGEKEEALAERAERAIRGLFGVKVTVAQSQDRIRHQEFVKFSNSIRKQNPNLDITGIQSWDVLKIRNGSYFATPSPGTGALPSGSDLVQLSSVLKSVDERLKQANPDKTLIICGQGASPGYIEFDPKKAHRMLLFLGTDRGDETLPLVVKTLEIAHYRQAQLREAFKKGDQNPVYLLPDREWRRDHGVKILDMGDHGCLVGADESQDSPMSSQGEMPSPSRVQSHPLGHLSRPSHLYDLSSGSDDTLPASKPSILRRLTWKVGSRVVASKKGKEAVRPGSTTATRDEGLRASSTGSVGPYAMSSPFQEGVDAQQEGVIAGPSLQREGVLARLRHSGSSLEWETSAGAPNMAQTPGGLNPDLRRWYLEGGARRAEARTPSPSQPPATLGRRLFNALRFSSSKHGTTTRSGNPRTKS